MPAPRVPTTIPATHLPAAHIPTANLPSTNIPTADLPTAHIPTSELPSADYLESAETMPTTDLSHAAHHLAEAIWQVKAIAE